MNARIRHSPRVALIRKLRPGASQAAALPQGR